MAPLRTLKDRALLEALARRHAPKQVLKYGQATHLMLNVIDGKNGRVRDVYAGRDVKVSEIGGKSSVTLNAEHTFPKSQGVKGTAAKSDLFHLFPADSEANRVRASLPFGEVEQVEWSKGGSTQGLDARGVQVFEPPEEHRGDVARALFYVSTVYGLPLDDAEEAVLKKWNRADPPDAEELARDARIKAAQGNDNPFVVDPTLPERINDF